MTTGTKIRQLREKRRFSQEELAYMVGVSQVTIGNWEQGKSIKHEYIPKLAQAFGVTTDFLLGDFSSTDKPLELTDQQMLAKDFEIIIKAPNHIFDDLNKKMDFIINRFGNTK